jgi:hypothetical protein
MRTASFDVCDKHSIRVKLRELESGAVEVTTRLKERGSIEGKRTIKDWGDVATSPEDIPMMVEGQRERAKKKHTHLHRMRKKMKIVDLKPKDT